MPFRGIWTGGRDSPKRPTKGPDLISAKRHVRRTLAIGLMAGALIVPAQSASAATSSITLEVSCDQATQTTSVLAHGSGYLPDRGYTVNLYIATSYWQVGAPFGWTASGTSPDAQKHVVTAADGTWTVPFTWQQTPLVSASDYLYFAQTPSVGTWYGSEFTYTKGSPCVFIDNRPS